MRSKDRVYIIPTRYGLIYGASAIVCVLYGMIYANNLAYLVSFFLLGIFVIGMHQSNSNLKKIKIEKINIEPIPAQSLSYAKIYLKSLSSEGHTKLSIKSKNHEDEFSARVDQIQAKSLHTVSVQIKTKTRGKKNIDKLILYSEYPFGLFYVWKVFTLNTDYYVHPNPAGSLPLPINTDLGPSLGKNKHQSGDEFEQHKIYQKGDSQKRIDWKALARGRPKLIKKFSQMSQGKIQLRLHELQLPIEDNLRQISKWVMYCESKNLNYSLELDTIKIKSGRGHSQKRKCLKALAEVQIDRH